MGKGMKAGKKPKNRAAGGAKDMNKHSANGWNGDALYFSMAENAAPIDDAIRYKPRHHRSR